MGFKDKPWEIPNPNRVKLATPLCVSYGHPDLSLTHKYLIDFGLVKTEEDLDEDGRKRVFYRGYGVQPVAYIAVKTPEPVFLGVYFEAGSALDFEKVTKVPGAGTVRPFLDGKVVAITEPSGVQFHVAFGYTKRDFTPRQGQVVPINYPAVDERDATMKPRRGYFHRLIKDEPVPVHKFGHCGFFTKDIHEACDFFCTFFNFKPSDVIMASEDSIRVMFMHLDLGKNYSDHHCLFLVPIVDPASSKAGEPHHAAFEVESIDTQFIGHDYLASQGYQPWWGIGRHVEGSQVFDYWFDLDGFIVEHYADGDIVNEDHPITVVPARTQKQASNWGPLPRAKAQTISLDSRVAT